MTSDNDERLNSRPGHQHAEEIRGTDSNSEAVTGDSERPQVRLVEVLAADDGQRVDNFLLRELRGVPRSRIYGLLRKGEVRVNGGRAKPGRRLAEGETVRIPPVFRTPPGEKTDQHQVRALESTLAERIIFDADGLLALDKPAGIAVHGGSGISVGVIEAVRAMRPDSQIELVHRIDRDTSGVLLLARRGAPLKAAHKAFADGLVVKRYRAWVAGRWPRHRYRIDAPLERYARGGERLVRVAATGRASVTEFQVLKQQPNSTLIEARPQTGRTHQIRVHAAHAGHPILGDPKYGDGSEHKRLFLHAMSLELPWEGGTLLVTAPVPAEFEVPE